MQGQNGTARQLLCEHVEEKARWRESKASELADDLHHARSAEALMDLADYVRGLPDEDETLTRLEVVRDSWGPDASGWWGGEESDRMLTRLEFEHPGRPDFDTFLIAFAEVVEREERKRLDDLLATEVDSPEVQALLDEFDEREAGRDDGC